MVEAAQSVATLSADDEDACNAKEVRSSKTSTATFTRNKAFDHLGSQGGREKQSLAKASEVVDFRESEEVERKID